MSEDFRAQALTQAARQMGKHERGGAVVSGLSKCERLLLSTIASTGKQELNAASLCMQRKLMKQPYETKKHRLSGEPDQNWYEDSLSPLPFHWPW